MGDAISGHKPCLACADVVLPPFPILSLQANRAIIGGEKSQVHGQCANLRRSGAVRADTAEHSDAG